MIQCWLYKYTNSNANLAGNGFCKLVVTGKGNIFPLNQDCSEKSATM